MRFHRIIIITFLIFIYQVGQSQTITETDGFKWIKFTEDGYVGAKSINGNILVPADFSDCYIKLGRFFAKDRSGQFAIYEKNGRVLIEGNKYTHIITYDMENSPFKVISSEGYGMYSHDGVVLLKDGYDAIDLYGDMNSGFFMICNNGYKGIANLDGKIIIPANKYHEVFRIGDHISGHYSFMVYTENGNQSGVCDLTGKEIIRTNHYQTFGPAEGITTFYNIYTGSSYGKIDLKGNIIERPNPILSKTPIKVDNNTFQMVCDENNKFGMVDSYNRVIIPVRYDKLAVLGSTKYITVWKGNHMGLYNAKGKCIVPTESKYISVAEIENAIVATTERKTRALYSKDGKLIALPDHKHSNLTIATLPNGELDTTIAFMDNRYWGIKKLDGTRLIKPIYDDFNTLCTVVGTYFYSFRNNKVGICDYHTGQELIPPIYTDISIGGNADNPFFFLTNGTKYGVAKLNGNVIIPSETFNYIHFDERTRTFTAQEGSRVCTFNYNGVLLSDSQTEKDRDNYISLADSEFEKGNYSKAIQYYGDAIKLRSSATLYFNRGVSYYNNDSYTNAIADFRRCLSSDPSQNLIDRSRELIKKSEMYQQEKVKQRQEIACNIIGLIFSTANAVIQYSMEYHNGTSSVSLSSNSSTDYSDSSSSYSYNDDSEDSSSSSSYSSSWTSSSTETTNPKYDAKQQFKTQGVNSNDYQYKKKVTLYTRNGDNAKVMFSKDLYKKGAYYYVKIGNKYYSVNYSNWSRYNKSIMYGHESLYFNL